MWAYLQIVEIVGNDIMGFLVVLFNQFYSLQVQTCFIPKKTIPLFSCLIEG